MDDGVYYFSVNVEKHYASSASISINHNEKRVCDAHNSDKGNDNYHYMMTCSATINAVKSDKISVMLNGGSIDANGSFVGFLISLDWKFL